MRRRRALTLVTVALCAVLVACSSGRGTAWGAGDAAPTQVASAYFAALMLHQRATARRLVCPPFGWQGPRTFQFVMMSLTRYIDARAYVRSLRPTSRHIAGAWLVSLEPGHGPGSLPLFRVVQSGGRYFVCGYVKR